MDIKKFKDLKAKTRIKRFLKKRANIETSAIIKEETYSLDHDVAVNSLNPKGENMRRGSV